ncbi:MAG: DUF4293 domain-containing protein [Odoribacteraceae bacterium]|jgi:hypothetical protein|nr:DUF4293 domain-containing protein [Odoribacteraceae bacterium]
MIQRKQTLYLLLVTILVTLPLIFSFARIPLLDGFRSLSGGATGETGEAGHLARFYKLLDTAALTAWCGFMIVLPVIAILAYKKRRLQRRLCIAETALLLAAILFGWIAGPYRTAEGLLSPGFILLAACTLLVLLAIRGINKDINLLKSYDRIR